MAPCSSADPAARCTCSPVTGRSALPVTGPAPARGPRSTRRAARALHHLARTSSRPRTWHDDRLAGDAPQLPPVDSTALLGPTVIEAGVGALAQRNQRHFESMDEGERAQALETWRELAGDVLAGAHQAAFGGGPPPHPPAPLLRGG